VTTTGVNPRLEAALMYAALGWPVLPLHTPGPDGVCDCPKRAECPKPGKDPRTLHGLDDATTDETTICRWWKIWPHANVAIDLARSGLVDIAPDSIEWFAEFTARGLPPTLQFASGGGEGHAHYLYRRPADCAVYRLTVSGDYDVLSAGYAVMPPSLHQSQRTYTWLDPTEGLPICTPAEDAPRWVIDMLNAKAHRPQSQPIIDDPDAPPVELRGEALERWHGRLFDTNRKTGQRDRSHSLWSLAVALLDMGCRPGFTQQLIAERDVALGWEKFSDRRNAGERYRVIVGRAVAGQGPRARAHPNGSVAHEPRASRSFIITNLATVEAEVVQWLWHYRVPLGKLTLLDGDPDLGKSLTTLDLAARLSTDRTMPDGTHVFDGVAGTVLLSAEDGIADTIRPRIDAAGGDPARVVALEGIIARKDSLPAMPSLEDLDAIEAAVRSVNAKLIVVDPIMAYLPSSVDSFKDQQVRRMLGPLVKLIASLNVALICVRHLTKDASKPALYRGGASIGFVGAARSVMLVGLDPSDDTKAKRILARVKGNLAPRVPSLIYEVSAPVAASGQPQIRWHKETSDLTADDLLQPRQRETAEVQSQLTDAEEFLRETLANGPRPISQIMAEAQTNLGLSKRTVERAKARVPEISLWHVIEDGRQEWFWRLNGRGGPP
jgi:Bifunctional DNA primase/polymerase, N-terminal/AAA domain